MMDSDDDFVFLDAADAQIILTNLKIILLGPSGVGKTSLITQLADGIFSEDHGQTQNVDCKTYRMRYENSIIQVCLWDTVGMERFRALPLNLLRDVHGVAFVYDVSDRNSFSELYKWYESLQETLSECKRPVIIVIGNKLDKEHKDVTRAEGSAFARSKTALFLETSAKTGEGVNRAFKDLVCQIIETPELWRPNDSYAKIQLGFKNRCRCNERGRRRKRC